MFQSFLGSFLPDSIKRLLISDVAEKWFSTLGLYFGYQILPYNYFIQVTFDLVKLVFYKCITLSSISSFSLTVFCTSGDKGIFTFELIDIILCFCFVFSERKT